MTKEEFIQEKFNEVLGLARFTLLTASKIGAPGDKIVLKALEEAHSEEWGRGSKKYIVRLSHEQLKALSDELLKTCRELFDESHAQYIQEKAEHFFYTHYPLKRQAKAKQLIEQAEAQAEAAFAQWVGKYLPERLEFKTEVEKAEFLRQRFRQIQDWFAENPDIMLDGTPEDVLRWVTTFFVDLEDGLQPRHRTPERLKNVLADRLKAKRCLAHIRALLTEKPAPAKQEATTSVFALTLWYRFSAGLLPELDFGKPGRKTKIFTLAEERGVSGQYVYDMLLDIPQNKARSPKRNLEHIRKAAEELAEYPNAQALALKDIEAYPKKE